MAVCSVFICGKVHHSRAQDPAVPVLLQLPKANCELKKVLSRCFCFNGLSGQCGHVVALCVQLFRLLDRDAFDAAFRKNSDGRKRCTLASLEDMLAPNSSKKEKSARSERVLTIVGSVTAADIGVIAQQLLEPAAEKRKKQFAPQSAEEKERKAKRRRAQDVASTIKRRKKASAKRSKEVAKKRSGDKKKKRASKKRKVTALPPPPPPPP